MINLAGGLSARVLAWACSDKSRQKCGRSGENRLEIKGSRHAKPAQPVVSPGYLLTTVLW